MSFDNKLVGKRLPSKHRYPPEDERTSSSQSAGQKYDHSHTLSSKRTHAASEMPNGDGNSQHLPGPDSTRGVPHNVRQTSYSVAQKASQVLACFPRKIFECFVRSASGILSLFRFPHPDTPAATFSQASGFRAPPVQNHTSPEIHDSSIRDYHSNNAYRGSSNTVFNPRYIGSNDTRHDEQHHSKYDQTSTRFQHMQRSASNGGRILDHGATLVQRRKLPLLLGYPPTREEYVEQEFVAGTSQWTSKAVVYDFENYPYDVDVFYDTSRDSNSMAEEDVHRLGLATNLISPEDKAAYQNKNGPIDVPPGYVMLPFEIPREDVERGIIKCYVLPRTRLRACIHLGSNFLDKHFLIESSSLKRSSLVSDRYMLGSNRGSSNDVEDEKTQTAPITNNVHNDAHFSSNQVPNVKVSADTDRRTTRNALTIPQTLNLNDSDGLRQLARNSGILDSGYGSSIYDSELMSRDPSNMSSKMVAGEILPTSSIAVAEG